MEKFDHGFPDNKYNKHSWILGFPGIGEGVWIGAFCLIDAAYASLKIGRGCNISSGAQILTHSTVKRCVSERRYGKIDASPTEIGEFCFIGTNAVILKGVNIGHHSVIAAGAVVTEGMKIPPFSVVSGVPGKVTGNSKKFLDGVDKEAVSVVIPAYNEEETVTNVVKEAQSEIEKIGIEYEIVLVDDGSTDKTTSIIDNLAKNKHIRVIHHKQNKGFTGAISTCYRSAKNPLIFLAPADGQFDFKEFGKFLEAIKGYDVAVGYRISNPEPISRKLNSKVFHTLCRILLGIHLKEISTVIMWRKFVLDSLTIESEDRSAMIEPELIAKAIKMKYKFIEVPIHFMERRGGVPKGANITMIIKTFTGMIKFWNKYFRDV